MHPLPAAPAPIAPELEEVPSLLVETRLELPAPASRVWEELLFYEQIVDPPPLHLRLLLPIPVETKGKKSDVGDEALCLYRGGHLVKRVTGIEPGRRYAFSVVEQALDVGGGMKLHGGEYTLREVGPGRTVLSVSTRYTSTRWPRSLWIPLEAWVCHSFHRHLLRTIRKAAARRR